MDTSKGIRICLKLINNIQGRTSYIVKQIDEKLAGRIKDKKITTLLENTNMQLLTSILDCLDYLESIVIYPDEEDLDPKPSHVAADSDLAPISKQQLIKHLPNLYEDIEYFVSDQFDNINEVKYMIQICCYSSNEKYNTAVEMIEIIESRFDQMEELFSLGQVDDSGISERESHNSYKANANDSEVSGSDSHRDATQKHLLYDSFDDSLLDHTSFSLPYDSYDLPDIPQVTRGDLKHVHLKKDGTPDKRYKENKPILLKKDETYVHLKKDGTPDRRYKENKQATKSLTSANKSVTKGSLKKDITPDKQHSSENFPVTSTPRKTATSSLTPVKKDGTPDMRFAVNKSSTSTASKKVVNKKASTSIDRPATPLKKDGTPDMRYAANKSRSSSSASSYSGSVSSYGGGSTSGPLKKDGTPDMQYAANKSSGSSSTYSSSTGGSSYGGSSSYYGSSRSSSSSSYYSGGSSYGGSSSSSSYCPGPTTKSGAPDMRYAVNKAYYN